MSRGQENQVVDTSQQQNKQFNDNAQTSYTAAQGDIGNYQSQLAKFAADNPYTAGGAFQTDQNKITANTSDAAAQAAGQTLQSQAVRTGQNTAGAISATEAMQQQNERTLSGQQAEGDATRINAGAKYGDQVLSATGLPATLESNLTSVEAGQGNTALGVQQKAAETPSFGEDLMSGVMQAGASFAGGYGKARGGCWIAAELYNGWNDPRVILIRLWMHHQLVRHWYGRRLIGLYMACGAEVAETIKTQRWARPPLRWIFNGALRRAEQWMATKEGGLICSSDEELLEAMYGAPVGGTVLFDQGVR